MGARNGLPGLRVEGSDVALLSHPLPDDQAAALVVAAKNTEGNEEAQDTVWSFGAEELHFANPRWHAGVSLAGVELSLGLPKGQTKLRLHSLLLCEEGTTVRSAFQRS